MPLSALYAHPAPAAHGAEDGGATEDGIDQPLRDAAVRNLSASGELARGPRAVAATRVV